MRRLFGILGVLCTIAVTVSLCLIAGAVAAQPTGTAFAEDRWPALMRGVALVGFLFVPLVWARMVNPWATFRDHLAGWGWLLASAAITTAAVITADFWLMLLALFVQTLSGLATARRARL